MVYNFSALRGRIREKYGTEYEFAKSLGLSRTSMSKKVGNKVSFTSDEIIKSCELLEIPIENAHLFFLNTNLS